METRVHSDIGSFLVQIMKTSLLVIGCVPLLGGLGCYSLLMSDGLEEEDELLCCKGITTEEGTNTTTIVASHQEKYPEGKMRFERMMEPFGVGVSFKATTNTPTDPTQTAKVPETSNSEATFITMTSKIDEIKERAPLDMATEPFTHVKFGIGTSNYQGQTLSSHRVELEINGLAELSETVETEHFVGDTTSHIPRHWKYRKNVRLYNVKTNFIPTTSAGHSTTKASMARNQKGCNSDNVVVAQVHISVDFKTIYPKITEEIIITGAFGTSGTNKYVITLKE